MQSLGDKNLSCLGSKGSGGGHDFWMTVKQAKTVPAKRWLHHFPQCYVTTLAADLGFCWIWARSEPEVEVADMIVLEDGKARKNISAKWWLHQFQAVTTFVSRPSPSVWRFNLHLLSAWWYWESKAHISRVRSKSWELMSEIWVWVLFPSESRTVHFPQVCFLEQQFPIREFS